MVILVQLGHCAPAAVGLGRERDYLRSATTSLNDRVTRNTNDWTNAARLAPLAKGIRL